MASITRFWHRIRWEGHEVIRPHFEVPCGGGYKLRRAFLRTLCTVYNPVYDDMLLKIARASGSAKRGSTTRLHSLLKSMIPLPPRATHRTVARLRFGLAAPTPLLHKTEFMLSRRR